MLIFSFTKNTGHEPPLSMLELKAMVGWCYLLFLREERSRAFRDTDRTESCCSD